MLACLLTLGAFGTVRYNPACHTRCFFSLDDVLVVGGKGPPSSFPSPSQVPIPIPYSRTLLIHEPEGSTGENQINKINKERLSNAPYTHNLPPSHNPTTTDIHPLPLPQPAHPNPIPRPDHHPRGPRVIIPLLVAPRTRPGGRPEVERPAVALDDPHRAVLERGAVCEVERRLARRLDGEPAVGAGSRAEKADGAHWGWFFSVKFFKIFFSFWCESCYY
jgi:hypothetical protein